MGVALCMSCLFPLAVSAQETQMTTDAERVLNLNDKKTSAEQELDAAKTQKTPTEVNDIAKGRRDTLLKAMEATPPKRAELGAEFTKTPDMLETIENWIAGSVYDDPRHLVLRDILAGMPPQTSGPLMVQLAKKCREPQLQKHWDRYLRPYPKAYAQVLTTWLKISQADPAQVERLLTTLAEFYPQQALDIWIGLIENNSLKNLARLSQFGRAYPQATKQIIQRLGALDALDDPKNETAILRLIRVLHHLAVPEKQTLDDELEAILATVVGPLLGDERISRRLAALELLGDYVVQDLAQVSIMRFEKAKNTTEKAYALRALGLLDVENQAQRLNKAIKDSDPTLRLEAATQLAKNTEFLNTELPRLHKAFNEEIWPEIRQKLYAIIVSATNDEQERRTFQKAVVLNHQIDLQTRLWALTDFSQYESAALSLDELKKLIIQKAPLSIIAGAAEHIYLKTAEARPQLEQWLIAQLPLERRLTETLHRFIAAHKGAYQAQTHQTIQTICDKAEENPGTANICLRYFKNHTHDPSDKARLETLENLVPTHDLGLLDDF